MLWPTNWSKYVNTGQDDDIDFEKNSFVNKCSEALPHTIEMHLFFIHCI
jgi:hypothetical protein